MKCNVCINETLNWLFQPVRCTHKKVHFQTHQVVWNNQQS